jgi:hypothetical protein
MANHVTARDDATPTEFRQAAKTPLARPKAVRMILAGNNDISKQLGPSDLGRRRSRIRRFG